MESKIELKPCAFCGGEVRMDINASKHPIVCVKCLENDCGITAYIPNWTWRETDVNYDAHKKLYNRRALCRK